MNDAPSPISVWKKNASPADRLRELAHIAEKYPERFSSMLLIYLERGAEERTFRVRYMYGADYMTTEAMLGLLQMGTQQIWKDSFTHE